MKTFNFKNMRVGLVFPSYREYCDIVSLPENKQHLGAIPPLSLAYVAAILEKIGCKVKLIDASALNLTKEQVAGKLRDFNPDFIGFTSSTVDFHNTLSWINYLKEKLKVPTIIGGIHLSIYPKETLTHQAIDYGVIGEAEETLPALLECLVHKEKGLNRVKGICYRDNGRIIVTERRELQRSLDECLFPARHLLPNDSYYSFISKEKRFTAMLTSRGCPFHCIFCDNQTIPYRYRSPKNVVDEMEQCCNLFKIKEIDIFDALFSVSSDRVIQICREIKRRRLKLKWSFRTRVDLVTKEMLGELKGSGCIRIYYGIESGDPVILKNINKSVDIDTIKKIVKLTKQKGIEALGYFMIGNIGENKETIRRSLKLMLELPLDYVQISPVFVPPNTILYRMIKEQTGKDYWSEYTINPEKEDKFPRYGTNLTDEQVNRYIYKCYLRFYLRFGYILRFMFRLRSWQEFVRSVQALKDVIFSFFGREFYKGVDKK
ncbi:MAG: cobalamin-dependent protein [Candidatus Omnitrophica bacterium]|nr:cobalamin-dependent protein [Candidatus Omnitrophota bacterium]